MQQRLAGQRIEHKIDAGRRNAADGLRERQIATVEHGVGAKCRDRGLLIWTGGRNDPRAKPAGDLHGRLSHATGCGVDQHRFARLQPAAFDQAVPRGQERDRHAGAQFGAEVGGRGATSRASATTLLAMQPGAMATTASPTLKP